MRVFRVIGVIRVVRVIRVISNVDLRTASLHSAKNFDNLLLDCIYFGANVSRDHTFLSCSCTYSCS